LAQTFGAPKPDWYISPFGRTKKPVDPQRPATICTKLAEAGVPESTMLDMMGHVSAAMLRRYSHIRRGARRSWLWKAEFRTEYPQKSPQSPVPRFPGETVN
jgi:hypothetical protein